MSCSLILHSILQIFDGTVTGGKNSRALLALESFQALNPEAETAEVHRMAECASILEMVGREHCALADHL